MSKAPAKPTPSHDGIPRTHSEAKKLASVKPSKLSYDKLIPERKAQFIKFSESRARTGSICGVGPSNDPNMVLICYKNDLGECHWVEMPKGATPPTHG
jgi:hypothetical protein